MSSSMSPFPSPIDAPAHILTLLSDLHKQSLAQEAALSKNGKVMSTTVLGDLADQQRNLSSLSTAATTAFDALMLDKFIALDEDKCHFMYQLILATNAANIVEAGTSFGISTIYLALAVGKVKKVTGKEERIVATEKEVEKAEVARGYWRMCGQEVEGEIELRVGDLLETLGKGLKGGVDLLLLDIWAALALPTLKIVQPKLRHGAVVLVDNTISGAKGYADLLTYLRAPGSGFHNMTLPFTNGFEMCVYLPESR